jgi:His-Xaa-Ser system protein HxsD
MGSSAPMNLDWSERSEDGLTVIVDLSVYPEDALFRTCYLFTDRCYLFLDPAGPGQIRVRFRKRDPLASLMRMVGEFGNELINQRIRLNLAIETRAIRELIVAQAFAEADLGVTP